MHTHNLNSTLFFRQLFDRASCTYTYLLADSSTKEAILIDPVDTQLPRDINLLSEHGLTLVYAMNTHAHADHISASGLLKAKLPNVRSVLGKASLGKADVLVTEGNMISVGEGNLCLRVIETPGHTTGCVSYHLDQPGGGMVFTGDTLLIRGCGRTDFQGGSSRKLFESVKEKLFKLSGETEVFPAHDYHGMTKSTIAEEIKFNPKLKEGVDVEEFTDVMNNLKLKNPEMINVAVPANLNCGVSPVYV